MSKASKPGPSGGNGEEKEKDERMFECNICLDTAKDAVVSLCGHLFCWPCLHQWLETRPVKQVCPVCKAAISKEKVVPLYGRGSTQQNDPRQNVPPRPAGQRTEPESNGGFLGFGDGGLHMSFGIGAFPLGLFTSSFTLGDNRPSAELIVGDSEDLEEMDILTDSSTEGEEENEVVLSESEEEEVGISVSEDDETAATFISEDEEMRTSMSESSGTDDDVISFL